MREVVWVIQASCFLQRLLHQNIQDDDFMFELDGLEILTQKKDWIDHRRVFANLVSRPSIVPNGGSEKTQNYPTTTDCCNLLLSILFIEDH